LSFVLILVQENMRNGGHNVI